MDERETASNAKEIMAEFARFTGLDPISQPPIRYLWTDAFAVCNFLELHAVTGERRYLELAGRLVDQVHHVLGRHRPDDFRKGWISGLNDEDGEEHPTAGGLRIGKKNNERRIGEPYDDYLEWEQDGQYFHYLSKWMHALVRMGKVSAEPKYVRWAAELARRANSAFCYVPTAGGRKRMYWKMSIDLSRPLVPSMGQHDPLDGYVTYNEIQLAQNRWDEARRIDLSSEIDDIGKILRLEGLPTEDALGMGGLLMDGTRVAQIESAGRPLKEGLIEALVDAALISVESFSLTGDLDRGAERRLAFRELGLSIGLKGVSIIARSLTDGKGRAPPKEMVQKLADLAQHAVLGENIERFWTDKRNQRAGTWSEHRDINMVMLATSLAPESFLSV